MAQKSKKVRVGDVLGLGTIAGSPIPGDEFERPHEPDAESRRRRMNEGADELTPGATAPRRHGGATGIDLGAVDEVER